MSSSSSGSGALAAGLPATCNAHASAHRLHQALRGGARARRGSARARQCLAGQPAHRAPSDGSARGVREKKACARAGSGWEPHRHRHQPQQQPGPRRRRRRRRRRQHPLHEDCRVRAQRPETNSKTAAQRNVCTRVIVGTRKGHTGGRLLDQVSEVARLESLLDHARVVPRGLAAGGSNQLVHASSADGHTLILEDKGSVADREHVVGLRRNGARSDSS
jgi:hypothetical protein